MGSHHLVVIGRSEYITITGVTDKVAAKMDTGAYRSSIHCSGTEIIERDGVSWLRFKLFGGHPLAPIAHELETDKYSVVKVVSSSGDKTVRYVVELRVKIGSKIFNTSFTLADRSKLFFPVLIGRSTLRSRYLIDVDRTGVDRLALREELDIKQPRRRDDNE